jgi:hypothetical protein
MVMFYRMYKSFYAGCAAERGRMTLPSPGAAAPNAN